MKYVQFLCPKELNSIHDTHTQIIHPSVIKWTDKTLENNAWCYFISSIHPSIIYIYILYRVTGLEPIPAHNEQEAESTPDRFGSRLQRMDRQLFTLTVTFIGNFNSQTHLTKRNWKNSHTHWEKMQTPHKRFSAHCLAPTVLICLYVTYFTGSWPPHGAF